MKKLIPGFLALSLIAPLFQSCKQAADSGQLNGTNYAVYEWRGPDRNGIYSETGLLSAWPESGPELVWEFDSLGDGYGSPVFTPDRMYILGVRDSIACLFAFDTTGTLDWTSEVGPEWMVNFNGTRSTPTVVGDLVYTTTGMGKISCLDRHTGELQWTVDMKNDLHGTFPLFGYSESLICDGDRIFCSPGGADTNVVALNRFDGSLLWISKGDGERPGYNSPRIIHLDSLDILVNFSAYDMMGHNTKTGELLWMHPQDNIPVAERKPGMGDTHSNTVLYADSSIYYAEGDGNCGVKLKLAADGLSITELWRNTAFDSYMGGIVKIGDHLYGCGTADRDFKMISTLTGETENSIKAGSGVVIAAEGLLYYYNQKGEMMLIRPESLEVISSFRIKKGTGEHFSHPVISNGRLYIRHGNTIQAYNIKAS
ncbi:MAG: PQQ-binding-like beta-propeller repeat protein [Bacteroidota bacterium]